MAAAFRSSSVREFLQSINLSKHVTLLEGQGYRNINDIFLLTEKDLDLVHIKDNGERDAILTAVDKLDISSWLAHHGLTLYEQLFKTHGISTVGQLKTTVLNDDVLDELEVMVPGDRKRLQNAASHICMPAPPDEEDVMSTVQAVTQQAGAAAVGSLARASFQAVGYWGKNDVMPTTKDILWVECIIKSNISESDNVTVLCMVDTGSEVVTCEEHLVTRLGLEFIKIIDSKGIHNVEKKSLYKGRVMIGTKELEVEIIPDSYNSVGCNVISKFFHFINHERHVWFE